MKIIEYNVFRRDTRSASGKAKNDISDILELMGFEKLYCPSRIRLIRILQQWCRLRAIQGNDLVIAQYPANIDYFYSMIEKSGATSVAVIHDLESLRGIKSVQDEISVLNRFDCVISHTPEMADYLEKSGFKGVICELGLFDYLAPNRQIQPRYDASAHLVSYAGNLSKSPFVVDLGRIRNLDFELIGLPAPDWALPDNVGYAGSFPAESVPFQLRGSWGLVWDGCSLASCENDYGQYLRYNCPHKASMYIIAEQPLIVWEKAAIAQYVRSEGIGITVRSLAEAADVISGFSAECYYQLLENVRRVKSDLIVGNHFKTALRKAISAFDGQFASTLR